MGIEQPNKSKIRVLKGLSCHPVSANGEIGLYETLQYVSLPENEQVKIVIARDGEVAYSRIYNA